MKKNWRKYPSIIGELLLGFFQKEAIKLPRRGIVTEIKRKIENKDVVKKQTAKPVIIGKDLGFKSQNLG